MKLARSFLVFASLAAAVLGVGATGCTATATASAPSSCGTDDTVVCLDGAGYSCTGGDRPDDTDRSLLCSSGREGNAGALLYCCLQAVASSSTTCGPDSTVAGCAPGSFGFSCADSSEPPSASYPSLTCSSPIQGNAGSALYCCAD
jgi:hypothetical protein